MDVCRNLKSADLAERLAVLLSLRGLGSTVVVTVAEGQMLADGA